MILEAHGGTLTPAGWHHLQGVTDAMYDELCEDLARLRRGRRFAGTSMAAHMPRAFLARYDYYFAKRFFACFVTVTWKIFAPDHCDLACVVEEMMLHAILYRAMDETDDPDIREGLDLYYDVAFQDTDFLMLFDPRWDGIQETWLGEMFGIGFLDFDQWFTPFNNVPYVHPYARGQEVERPPVSPEEEEDLADI